MSAKVYNLALFVSPNRFSRVEGWNCGCCPPSRTHSQGVALPAHTEPASGWTSARCVAHEDQHAGRCRPLPRKPLRRHDGVVMTGDQNGGVPPQPPRPSFGGNLRAALKVTGLSRTAKLILVCIAAHANEDGENSRTSYATMAVAGECSRRYAMLICEQLRHDGLITLTCPGRRGRGLDAPNTFALNVEKLLERQHSRGDLQSSPQTKSRG